MSCPFPQKCSSRQGHAPGRLGRSAAGPTSRRSCCSQGNLSGTQAANSHSRPLRMLQTPAVLHRPLTGHTTAVELDPQRPIAQRNSEFCPTMAHISHRPHGAAVALNHRAKSPRNQGMTEPLQCNLGWLYAGLGTNTESPALPVSPQG